jgi:hypothetical protein
MDDDDVTQLAASRLSDDRLLVELGRRRRSEIKELKRGEGPLAREVQALAEAFREPLGIEAGVEIIPVVLLYRERAGGYSVVYAGPQHPPETPGPAGAPEPGHETE